MVKTWFITGTSSGFGREWAIAALERGDRVAATARNIDQLQGLVERYGTSVLVIRLDVTDRAAALAAVQEAADHFGSLDVVINNAGYGHFGMIEELSEQDIRTQMETNFFGSLWVIQAALPIMRAQGFGHLIQVTSEGGIRTFAGVGAYHASKWALEGLSQTLSQEVGSFGLHVTNVEPGPYSTDWLTRGSRSSAPNPAYDALRESTAATWDVGDPTATRGAILAVVDAEQPPLRVFFGKSLEPVAEEYAERLKTWSDWQAVSLQAFGQAAS